jgi:hypothetical protein
MNNVLTQYQFLDPHIDDLDTVLAIRAKALQLYSEGKTLVEWDAEGSSGKRQFVAPIQEILAETRMYLKQKDPETYGYPITRMKVFRAM